MLPRIMQIAGGLFVAAYSVLTMGCAAVMFDWPDPTHALAIAIIGLVVEAGAIFTFIKAADILFGRRTHGRLIGAKGMRIIAGVYFIMLMIGLATGGTGQSFGVRGLAFVGGLFIAISLLVVARRREAERYRDDASRFDA